MRHSKAEYEAESRRDDALDQAALRAARQSWHARTFTTTPARIAEEHRLELASIGVAT